MKTMDALKQEAQDFIQQIVKGDFAGAGSLFDSNMVQAFSEARLKETWLQITGQVGPFQKLLACQATENQESQTVTVSCQFEKAPIAFRMVFNQSGKMSGLTAQPLPLPESPYHPPAYVNADAFRETGVTIGSGEWALPGTLSLPDGSSQKLPAIILVHGSGPSDRDETIGPNKPFRDLAWGLASQGVAVLRYDKRTFAHKALYTPELISKVTVDEETVDDALLAVQLLRQIPRIDPGRVFILGHSLGATLAPRIGQQDPSIAGLILMGGMARPFEDTILDQYTYLYRLSGAITDGQRAELEELKARVARVKDLNLSDQVSAKDLPLDLHPAYWLSLRGYQPAEVAKSLAMRIFVLQGGRDYQVTSTGDFPVWQKALGEKSNATLKLYPKLFHLFISGEGPSTPQEYLVEGHVSDEVIQDIAGWIKKI
ncbi:MAG: alpha/beta fold hydrolase [Anaerolineaceae bacterium]|nr:alpha/beta fold hydrolase [Anaerolineaceae bacterium]